MSATLAPQGLVPTRHLSGIIRVENQVDGIASGYGTNVFTGTPITRDANGNITAAAITAAAPVLGVFQGCEFTAATKRFVLPYWPAGQTYDAGSMIVKFTAGIDIIYEGQSLGPVAATAIGGGINVGAASQGSTFTGFSTQTLSAATDATAGSFIVWGLAPYEGNAWGDAYTRLLVKIAAEPVAA